MRMVMIGLRTAMPVQAWSEGDLWLQVLIRPEGLTLCASAAELPERRFVALLVEKCAFVRLVTGRRLAG